MKYILPIVLLFSANVSAQTRTITNTDLEKYRATRLEGERDLRENYERLGFSSPEVREARRQQYAREISELSARIELENAEKARIAREEAAAQAAAIYAQRRYEGTNIYYGYNNGSGFYSLPYFYSGYWRVRRFPLQDRFGQKGYVAGGNFWPVGSSDRPQPLFRPTPRH